MTDYATCFFPWSLKNKILTFLLYLEEVNMDFKIMVFVFLETQQFLSKLKK